MKKVWLAFLLNFVLPGAGLAYLGRWGLAGMNVLAVLSLGMALTFSGLIEAVPQEFRYLLPMAVSGGSGGWAVGLAQQHNERLEDSTGARRTGEPNP